MTLVGVLETVVLEPGQACDPTPFLREKKSRKYLLTRRTRSPSSPPGGPSRAPAPQSSRPSAPGSFSRSATSRSWRETWRRCSRDHSPPMAASRSSASLRTATSARTRCSPFAASRTCRRIMWRRTSTCRGRTRSCTRARASCTSPWTRRGPRWRRVASTSRSSSGSRTSRTCSSSTTWGASSPRCPQTGCATPQRPSSCVVQPTPRRSASDRACAWPRSRSATCRSTRCTNRPRVRSRRSLRAETTGSSSAPPPR